MHVRSRVGIHVTGVLALLASAALGRAQEYKIALDRPQKVGQRYTIHATGHTRQAAVINIPGAGPQNHGEEFTIDLDGTMKVLAVDEKSGQATKVECTVAKCLKDHKPLVDAGTVLTAESKGGKTVFAKDGAELDAATSDALSVIIETHQPGAPSNDQTFGTDRPQKVGATWPINANAAAASAAQSGITIAPDKIKGEGKLVAVKEVDGKQALQVEATMNVADLSLPQQKVDSGSVAATFGGLFPTDPAAFPLRSYQTMKMHITMTVAGPNGQAVKVESEVDRSNDIKFGPADK
jgi:hypothetical protein